MNLMSKACVALFFLFAATCAFLSQEGTTPSQERTSQSRTKQDETKTISVDVDIVLIPVTVTTERGQYLSGLEKQHFQILEDRVEQKIVYFSTEDAPMSLGIVLDSSGSMNPIIDPARRNGSACMSMGTESDEYFLIVFSDKLKVNTDFTTDLRKLRTQLLTVNSKGSTALYDAIYAGLAKVREGTNPRKALVVVSDGYDNHSRYSGKNVRDAIKETDVQLYLIGNEGDGALTALAESTGGRSLSPRTKSFELGNICNEIVRNLKNQYLIGYKSTNEAKDGKWRNVKVKVDPPNHLKLNVRSRTGYYAPSEQP
jgi:Ca-activated chloride channel family protein